MEDGSINNGRPTWLTNLVRFRLFIKRRMKLNRFLLVIDTKKGVTISAITVIVSNFEPIKSLSIRVSVGELTEIILLWTQIVDLIDLLWNLSMTFGPLNSTMSKCRTSHLELQNQSKLIRLMPQNSSLAFTVRNIFSYLCLICPPIRHQIGKFWQIEFTVLAKSIKLTPKTNII